MDTIGQLSKDDVIVIPSQEWAKGKEYKVIALYPEKGIAYLKRWDDDSQEWERLRMPISELEKA